MILGSKNVFAVEFEIDGTIALESPENFVFGHMCLWANSRMIGDYDQMADLMFIKQRFTHLLNYKGMRQASELWNEPKEIVFKTIDDAMYLDVGQSDEQVALDLEYYSKFIAVPSPYNTFDGWKGYIIEGNTDARYIWKHYDELEIHEAILPVGEFDSRLQEFIDLLDTKRTS